MTTTQTNPEQSPTIHTWPAPLRHEPNAALIYRTMGVKCCATSTRQMRRVYRFARRNGLSPMMARVTVVHAFQIGEADQRRATVGL